MELLYLNKLHELGYDQHVCDIFPKWEDVKDEILVPERKTGTGNGTIHVFLGAADNNLRKEFSSYYKAVEEGENPSIGAIKVNHFFLVSNVLSMLGYVCRYYHLKGDNINKHVESILTQLSLFPSEKGILSTSSYFKLSTGSSKLRPYFKQFESDGVFSKLIRQLFLPDSGYKISLYKNDKNEYAAFWLIGFRWLTNFEADSNDAYFCDNKSKSNNRISLQQIFYGAPGTGKSNTIKEKVEDAGKRHHRTTFHPDSDYSTFVGAYKPSMSSSEKIYSIAELIVKLTEIKNTGTTYPCHKFASKYWESLKDLSANEIKQILAACGFTEAYGVEVSKGIAIGQEYLNKRAEGKIVYNFVPQTFTKAYVDAWNTEEEVFLIIEEINRGNCAQIFGDLFQLLDRKNGISEYPIDADSDLEDYLKDKLKDSPRTDFPAGVKEGKKLVLPSNLYIWATMNTSDQSLFPIDSAFKRRWEWKYIPIKNHPDKNYKIEIGESKYDWWQFLENINREIGTITSSEDKKLGYFFAKAEDGVINDEQFVGKVLFYLWNDVFKNYGFDNDIFNKVDKEKLAFSDFFNADGSPNHENVNLFMKNLKVKDENKKEETNTGETTTGEESVQ